MRFVHYSLLVSLENGFEMTNVSEPRQRVGVRVMVIAAITGVGMMLGMGVSSADVPVACTDKVDLAPTSPCPRPVDPLVSGPDGGDIAAGRLLEPAGTRIG